MPFPFIVSAVAAFFASDCSDKKVEKRKADVTPADVSKLVQLAVTALANAPKNACRDEFAYIPAGSFFMGSGYYQSDARPVHTISTDAYCIAKSETTNAQYNAVINGTQDARSDGGEKFNGANKPVINVNWKDADAYCKSIGGRLPTEAEWEKAARGPEQLKLGTQSGQFSNDEANYGGFIGKTNDVCSYPVNGYSLCDMTGNVWEWSQDWYLQDAYASHSPKNPTGPDSGQYKVMRGKSWRYEDPFFFDVSLRGYDAPGRRLNSVGFRCVVAPKVSPPKAGTQK